MSRVLLRLAMLAALLVPLDRARADDSPWTQWMDLNHCSMARHGWLALAQQNPGFGWALSPGSQSNTTFMEGAAQLDFLRLSQAQTDTALMPSFRAHCCKVRIWENAQTGKTVIVKDGELPGFGFAESALNQGEMCCEDAVFAVGSDPMACTTIPLMSIKGAVVVMTPTGPTSPAGPITIASNPPLVVAAQGTPPGQGGYLGCFHDPNNPYDLDGYLERSRQNTPQRCIQICREKGFAYAGVQYSESCLCGNRYGQFGPADNCNMPCTGNSSQTCGGYSSNGVYRTGS